MKLDFVLHLGSRHKPFHKAICEARVDRKTSTRTGSTNGTTKQEEKSHKPFKSTMLKTRG